MGMRLLMTLPKVPPSDNAVIPRKIKANRSNKMMTKRMNKKISWFVESPKRLRASPAFFC